MMVDRNELRSSILEKMATVIDPETGVDVVHMRLIEDLIVKEDGSIFYTFRPSSVFCPIAVPLADSIQRAVAEVPGVTAQNVKVVGFVLSEELAALLKQALEDRQNKAKEQARERHEEENPSMQE
jgi:metal-sulfur cluster biosynthetic enzyme